MGGEYLWLSCIVILGEKATHEVELVSDREVSPSDMNRLRLSASTK